ncbi:MAG TPA: hypothetical protein DCE49_09045, partial [Pseudomonas sp.]|nr:hypothetical protein [Pseudomonas sp.]
MSGCSRRFYHYSFCTMRAKRHSLAAAGCSRSTEPEIAQLRCNNQRALQLHARFYRSSGTEDS